MTGTLILLNILPTGYNININMTDTQGHLLVAPPNMPDWRFQKSVIYIWRHDVSGAAGVIINKKCNHPDFDHVCQEGKIHKTVPNKMPVYYGGPVLTNIIGVLHTKDFQLGSSNNTGNGPVAFTLDRSILEVIAQGGGPKQKLITMGLANWESGQLENELDPVPPRSKSLSWLILPYDENIVFTDKPDDIWEECVNRAIKNKTAEITSKLFRDQGV
jgi:putative transcriptional regulator